VASPAQLLARDLRTELRALRAVTTSTRRSSRAVRARLAESVFLNGVTEFESFLERVFYLAVCRRIRPGGTVPLISIGDEDALRRIVLRPGESYLEWLPLDRSLKRASQFLDGGMPFARLERRAAVKDGLRAALVIRNAVAHKSDAARARFRQEAGHASATPGDYLIAGSAGRTVCDAFLADLARYGEALCVSEARATVLLGPEGPFETGKKVDAGQYRCEQCQTIHVLGEGRALACATCDPPCSECGAVNRTARFRPL
jgi:hypothetical protein